MKPRRPARPRKRLNPWPEWQARGLTLPDDATLERLSQPSGVASVGGRLIPYETEPQKETDQ